MFLMSSVFAVSSRSAQAKTKYYECCTCLKTAGAEDTFQWPKTEITIGMHIYSQLLSHQIIWFDSVFWQQNMLPLFIHIGNQLASVGTMQVMAIGQFMDAQQQLEAQRDLQIMRARTHKDYQPSVGMCEFATRVQSLAASERKGEVNALILSKRSTDRLFGNVDTGAWSGTKGDLAIRLNMFQEEFCNSFNNNNGLSMMCPNLKPPLSADKKDRLNKDIDYQRTVENPWTINFDLTEGGNPSDEDKEIFALASNLYGFDAFERANYEALQNSPNDDSTNAQQAYLDLRAIVAKTKVAENSFNALLAMKGAGTAGSREYLEAYLKELGIPASEVGEFLGENPSYNAQMEVLTKKAYQSPLFYTNLYDTPANVERKGVAMQAIGLIQKFDLLKSYLRTEASLSILLELSVIQLQLQVESNIQSFDN